MLLSLSMNRRVFRLDVSSPSRLVGQFTLRPLISQRFGTQDGSDGLWSGGRIVVGPRLGVGPSIRSDEITSGTVPPRISLLTPLPITLSAMRRTVSMNGTLLSPKKAMWLTCRATVSSTVGYVFDGGVVTSDGSRWSGRYAFVLGHAFQVSKTSRI